jgi:hypothetical protein
VHYGRLAGGRARAGLAFEEAAAHYEAAINALELVDEPDRELRADLKLALGNALRRAGDDHFRAIVRHVVDEARALGDGRLLARAALSLTGSDTGAADSVDTELVALLEDAVTHLADDDRVLRAQLLGAIAVELMWDPAQRERRTALSNEALAIVRETHDGHATARVLIAVHWATFRPDNVLDRLAIAEELVCVAESIGHVEARLYGHVARFNDLIELGDVERADADLDAACSLAEQLHRPMFMWGMVAHAVAGRAILAGRLDEAETAVSEATEAGQRAGVTGHRARENSESTRALLLWERGDLDGAIAVVRAMAAEAPAVLFWRAAEAALLADAERPAEARRAYDECVTGPGLADDPSWLAGTVLLASAAVALDDGAGAVRLRRELEPFAGRVAWNGVGAFGLVDLALARLSEVTGDASGAERHARAAVDLAARIGASRWLERARRVQAAQS